MNGSGAVGSGGSAQVPEFDSQGRPPRLAFAWTGLSGELVAEQGGDAQFPAVSTLKLVVLIEVYRAIDRGQLSLGQLVTVTSRFRSAADGREFQIPDEDLDPDLAKLQGKTMAVAQLIERMITVSSNDATNLLLNLVGLASLQEVLLDLGADRTQIQRPIGDKAAQARGLVNLVTPRDLCRLLSAIVSGRAASPGSCEQMLAVLGRQHYRDEIPAALPVQVRTANKNGWDPGLRHDAALVWPADSPGYCLAVCTEDFASAQLARAAIQARSRSCYASRRLVPAAASPASGSE